MLPSGFPGLASRGVPAQEPAPRRLCKQKAAGQATDAAGWAVFTSTGFQDPAAADWQKRNL